MRAILFPSRDTVQLTTLPDPQPGPEEVVVAIRASGICHTDIEVLHGNYGTSAFPLVPGHEFAGEIVECGPATGPLSVGDRVVVDPNIGCGTCSACKRGWAHLCENLGAYGVTVHGGFAENCVVHRSAVHPIGDMPFDMAALAEPIGCALNGVEAARADSARNALIFGAGPIGMLLAVCLQARGIDDIAMVDLNEDRLEFAGEFGFSSCHAQGGELAARTRGTDLVIDATGVPQVAQGLVDYVADGGTCLFFGVCPSSARIEVSPFEIFRRQLTLAGSHSLNHNIPAALEVLEKVGSDIRRLVSHRLPLEDVSRILASGAPAGSLKIQAAID